MNTALAESNPLRDLSQKCSHSAMASKIFAIPDYSSIAQLVSLFKDFAPQISSVQNTTLVLNYNANTDPPEEKLNAILSQVYARCRFDERTLPVTLHASEGSLPDLACLGNHFDAVISLPKQNRGQTFLSALDGSQIPVFTDWRALKLFLLRRSLPVIRNIQIQTHSRCNADCVFCPYIESWHAQNHGAMSDELFDRILSELEPFSEGINQGKFCPYLMQEPLLDKKIFERIEKIYEKFPNTCVEISTNAAALSSKVIDKMLKVFSGRNHEIWLSHHGIDKASLEFIMKIDYERSTKNIHELLERSKGRLCLRLRGAGTSRHGDTVFFSPEEYKAYWKKVIQDKGYNPRNIDVEGFTYHDRAGTIFRSERQANTNNLGVVREIDEANPFYCSRVDDWFHVMYDGTVRLCCMDYHAEVALPNIKEKSLVEYYKSEEFYDLVSYSTGLKESSKEFICKRCVSPGG